MQILNNNFKTKNDAISRQPVYVAEIFFANGNTGVDGINDIYFATCDVNDIVGFDFPARWYPFLQSDSVGSISQSVDPINGVSSIGSLDLKLTDYSGLVSNIIKAADAAGYGFRRQRITIHMLYKGMNWADKVKIRTMQINDLRLTSLNEYKITCADVQRQMNKTVFNPAETVLTNSTASSGAITVSVTDNRNFASTTQQVGGSPVTGGYLKIDDEIVYWDIKNTTTFTSFNIPLSGRGMFGTVAAAHTSGAKISEIIYLSENPITLALKILQSTGNGTNGTYDVYPANWGCGMDSTNDVVVTEWLEVAKLLTALDPATLGVGTGNQFAFTIDKGIEAKKFIEDEILKILGAFGFVHGDGRYGIKAYADLANAAKENGILLSQNEVIKWGDLTYNYNDLANQVWIEYDEFPKLSGKYLRNVIFIDSTSIAKWGEAKQLKYQVKGVGYSATAKNELYQRFQRVLSRYSRPPMQIDLTLLPKFHTLEIGDIVRVQLPIRDLFTGTSIDRAFEIISTQLIPATGEIQIKCIAQPEVATYWFGGSGVAASVQISPSTGEIVTGQTLQLTARVLDGGGQQIVGGAIAWTATGNLSVSSTGLVTAGAVGSGTVYAISGSIKSNIATLNVIATPNVNTVSSVTVSPSVISMQAGQTVTLTAVAKDLAGATVQGKVFNWASSTPATATVPAGASASVTLTAVANGTTNITATETTSSIASAATAVTVEPAVTPVVPTTTIPDIAYEKGTQLTFAGGVIPNGHNFASGDYWYSGDLILNAGTTCTINGTVRLFVRGAFTINGTITGNGRGNAGGAPVTTAPSVSPWGSVGNGTTYQSYVGAGGRGGGVVVTYNPNTERAIGAINIGGGVTAPPLYNSSQILNINTDLTNVPNNLAGAGGGSGANMRESLGVVLQSGAGGSGGAGLVIVSRGIFILQNAIIDLRGYNGSLGQSGSTGYWYAAHGGGGGGGSLILINEKVVVGGIYQENSSINTANIFFGGGLGATTGGIRDGSNGKSGAYSYQPL